MVQSRGKSGRAVRMVTGEVPASCWLGRGQWGRGCATAHAVQRRAGLGPAVGACGGVAAPGLLPVCVSWCDLMLRTVCTIGAHRGCRTLRQRWS